MWIGTATALIKYSDSNDATVKWRYYRGDRWLHGDGIVDVAINTTKSNDPKVQQIVYVATSKGLSKFRMEWWTLEEKANYLEAQTRERHLRYFIFIDIFEFLISIVRLGGIVCQTK